MSIEFLLTALVVVLMPGTGVINTLAVGLGRGFRASVLAAFGCTLGIVPHIAVKIAGILYLIYMAWSVLRSDGVLPVEGRKAKVSNIKLVRDGILLNVLNPKLSIFFLAFLPQFVPATITNPMPQFLLLASVFMGLTFAVFVLYGAFAATALSHSPRRRRS